MATLKLGRIPDRTPVKMGIALSPDLKAMLDDYADLYEAAYGRREEVAELIPYLLRAFLESDRDFLRARAARARSG
ncbi:hypothetical protein SAMN05428974_0502 [Sphingopyxis sp. YR583]|uniref:DUF2274 domain-containing protein n=1 Tax=Sphingopyxis sp. YR583 TaxID=1881047 RepID=UPI0008A7FAD8|nr:DUF2274 domain-containing protein [Sphingopyxis sp. YR583]SEH12558.1 hypothetical protein SAMN05428974_0502 [Sphingopyxis sp. YR583]